MISTRAKWLCALAISCFALLPCAAAQRRSRDPLTPAEIDQIRDTAQDPELRLKLYIKFARDRMDLIQQVRSELERELTLEPNRLGGLGLEAFVVAGQGGRGLPPIAFNFNTSSAPMPETATVTF